MTTNVTDLSARQMASDSRWSIVVPEPLPGLDHKPDFVIFIDDARFDKIVRHRGTAYMFAGNGRMIQAWKDWLASAPGSAVSRPPPYTAEGGIAICMVEMATAVVKFDKGQKIKDPDKSSPKALFAGSGARHAHGHWKVNRDALKAVEAAIAVDIFSGGAVKYVRFADGSHNLDEAETINDVTQRLAKKGIVMYQGHGNKAGISVEQAATGDPAVREVLDRIASGKLVAGAPFESMYEPWSEEDVRRLDAALNEALTS